MLNLPRINSSLSTDSQNLRLNFAFIIIKDTAHRLVLKYMLIVKELLEKAAVTQSKHCSWITNWSKKILQWKTFYSKNTDSTVIKLFHENPLSVKILSEKKQVGFLQIQTPQFLVPLLFWIDWTTPQGAIPSQESTTWEGGSRKQLKTVFTHKLTQL